MVAAGSGIALLPASLARYVGAAAVAVPLAKSPMITHVFAHPHAPLPRALQQFLGILPRAGASVRGKGTRNTRA